MDYDKQRSSDATAGYDNDAMEPRRPIGKRPSTARLPAASPQVVQRHAEANHQPHTAHIYGGGTASPELAVLDEMRGHDAAGVMPGAESMVARASGSASHALPSQLQQKFSTSLGADLSGVRVHTGGASNSAAHAVGAKAYTVGNDIHFSQGNYQPETAEGQHLLAHEVAHTVQQGAGMATRQHKLEVSGPQDHSEVEADRAADGMVRGERVSVSPVSSPTIARRPMDIDPPPLRPASKLKKLPLETFVPVLPWKSWVGSTGGKIEGAFSPEPSITTRHRNKKKAQTWFAAYRSAWGQGKASWSAYATHRDNFNNAADKAKELGITGSATGDHAEGVINSPKESGNLAKTVNEGTPTGASSNTKIGDLYGSNQTTDPASHELDLDAKKAVGDKPNDLLDGLINDYNSNTLINLESAVRGASNATLAAKAAGRAAAAALGQVDIAKLRAEQEGDGAEIKQLARQRDIALGGIKAAAGCMKVVESYTAKRIPAGMNSKFEFPADKPGAGGPSAAAGSGVVAAAEGVVSYIVSESYNQDINMLQRKIDTASQLISRYNVGAAKGALATAREAIIKAKNDAQTAKGLVTKAENARRKALKNISQAAVAAAKANNASPKDVAKLETAIRALPAVEMVATRLRQAAASVVMPGYSVASGRGASLAGAANAVAMTKKLSIMNGQKAHCNSEAKVWDKRAQEIRNLIGSLHSTERR